MVELITWTSLAYVGYRHYSDRRWFRVFPPRPHSLFSKESTQPISYWYRPHRSHSKSPILFLHGLGIGLWPYVPFLRELSQADPYVGIVIIEILPISSRITAPIPSSDEMCEIIFNILGNHSISKFTIVAHSFGSVIATHLLRSSLTSQSVHSLVLIDPVALLLQLPNTAYNFVYRRPRSANEWQLWYFASRDMGISHTLSRHFFWGDNLIWRDDLVGDGRKSCVALSESDQIMPSAEVRRYLTRQDEPIFEWRNEDFIVLFYRGLDHAQIFERKPRRAPLIRIISDFVELPDSTY